MPHTFVLNRTTRPPRPAWLLLLAAWLLQFLMLAPAAAQRADEGQYQILQARYGTSEQNVDVTSRLKELASRDRSFRASNETLGGDPHPFHVKVLRIYAKARDGSTRTFEYPEDATLDGAMFIGWSSGNWGQGGWNGGWGEGPRPVPSSGNTQPSQRDEGQYQILQARYGTEQHNVDVTPRLKKLASRDLRFRASNDQFGVDPHPNHVKVLRIYARGRDGNVRTFEYGEDATVDGALFTGWSSGNWGGGRGDGKSDGKGGWNGGWGTDGRPPRPLPPQPDNSPKASGKLVIVSASYGVGSRQRDVTSQLRGRISRDRLDVQVDNDMAGTDPAPGTPKQLTVTYTLGGGREQRVRVDENSRLAIP